MSDPAGSDRLANSPGPAFSVTRPSPWVRSWLVRNLPLRRLLPDAEPVYVSSVLYTMGVLTLASLVVTVLSGAFLALGGVQWWHSNSLGALVNSIHFWGVESFFLGSSGIDVGPDTGLSRASTRRDKTDPLLGRCSRSVPVSPVP